MDDSRKYHRIRDELTKAIRSGQFVPNQKLPSEARLSTKFSASRGTVLRALLDLTHAGLIERRRGSGTYVKAELGRSGGQFSLIAQELPDSAKQQVDVMGLIMRNIAVEAGRKGFSVIHHTMPEKVNGNSEHLRNTIATVIEQRSMGAIFLPMPLLSAESEELNLEIAHGLARSKVTTVLVDCDLTDGPGRSQFDLISTNNQQGGAALTEHMLEQGCKRIGFIKNVNAYTISERIAGYRGALLRHGVDFDERWELFAPELTPNVLNKWITAHKLDGLIFKDDGLAAMGCKYLTALGHKVGTDIKVAGFDDSPIASLLNVPLTTVRQPVKCIALNAVNLLLDRIQNPNQPGRSLLVNCELVVRDSTRNGTNNET